MAIRHEGGGQCFFNFILRGLKTLSLTFESFVTLATGGGGGDASDRDRIRGLDSWDSVFLFSPSARSSVGFWSSVDPSLLPLAAPDMTTCKAHSDRSA